MLEVWLDPNRMQHIVMSEHLKIPWVLFKMALHIQKQRQTEREERDRQTDSVQACSERTKRKFWTCSRFELRISVLISLSLASLTAREGDGMGTHTHTHTTHLLLL